MSVLYRVCCVLFYFFLKKKYKNIWLFYFLTYICNKKLEIMGLKVYLIFMVIYLTIHLVILSIRVDKLEKSIVIKSDSTVVIKGKNRSKKW